MRSVLGRRGYVIWVLLHQFACCTSASAVHSSNSRAHRAFPSAVSHVELRSKRHPAWCSIDTSWRYACSQYGAWPPVLTCAHSKPRPSKPGPFHIRPISTSSARCSSWSRHSNPRVRPSMCAPPDPSIRYEDPDGHYITKNPFNTRTTTPPCSYESVAPTSTIAI